MLNNEQGRPVGVFDSGLGGLTVVAEIWRSLPGESIIYVGDTARVPYGGRPADEIQEFNREIIRFLEAAGAKSVVVACNTSTGLALDLMTREFGLPLIGVIEPGAREAGQESVNGRIGLLATEGTVRSGAYEKAIASLAPGSQVVSQACPRLVPLIEAGRIDSAEMREALGEYLLPLLEGGVDTIILGCTHYPFLSGLIREMAGPEVKLVNPARATVRQLGETLSGLGLSNTRGKGQDRLYATGDPAAFHRLGEKLLGRRLPVCRKTQLIADIGVSVG